MKKKLIFFAYDMRIGGIESALVNLLNRINYDKYEVTLVLEKLDGEYLSKLNKNIIFEEYKVSNNKIIPIRKIKNFLNYLNWKRSHHNKYDFSCSYATYSLPGSKLALISSKNNSIYVHSDYYNALNNEEFLIFFKKLNIDKFKKIFFVSNQAKDNFLKVYSDLQNKTIVMNNFIDVDRVIKLSEEKIDVDKKFDKLLVFVGRLDESSKRITKLIEAMKHLTQNKNSIELWIIGDGPDKNLYIDLVKKYNLEKNIIFFGQKNNPYPYIKKSDYVVLTSRYEGFPVIYLEAISLKKKIISTINVTDQNIEIDKNFGYIIKSNDIGNEIEKIIKNDNLKCKEINLEKIYTDNIKTLEKVFDNDI